MLYSRETLSSILEKERATTSVIEKPCPKTAFLSAAEGTVVTNFEVTRSREMDGKVSKTERGGSWVAKDRGETEGDGASSGETAFLYRGTWNSIVGRDNVTSP
jgi:hypothetical protein